MPNCVPVSCLCLTYGRPRLLEEAIQSFLLQDYQGPKELIVLNDLAEQHLICDAPNVQIINLTRRFRTLGEKRNASLARARYDVVCPWDDDDICLPHRLSVSVSHLSSGLDFFKSKNAFVLNHGDLKGPEENMFHAASCYNRNAFLAVGGYRALDVGEDARFEWDLADCAEIHRLERTLPDEQEFYIYRFSGTGSYHISGLQGPSQCQSVGRMVREQIRSGNLATGTIELQPTWRRDYQQLVKDHLAVRKSALRSVANE